ncbi:GDP-L-fucose synthase [Bacillus sp. EB600]|uniref:GDP-L-fucose synthase family protein n=1 Tax=Bacillus sp. EB600 TaxID=2806345 RepID=UPI00210A2227|nr:GDP-L-fucose synthase [Bacillus sp. EB600]MCQ6280447.1 GDP-L-fucose synthase [Bacillus sp. EB600]
MSFIKGKKVMVTGGAGFLGSHVVELLKKKDCKDIIIPRSKLVDLRNQEACFKYIGKNKPDIVIHLAASVGGIGANKKNPATFLYDNLSMGLHLYEASRIYNVEKLITCGTICSYPKYTKVPFKEDDIWEGYPEETNAPYGLAKKILLVQGQSYRQQYGFNSIYLLPVNLYGPGDNFDLESSHVIPALIRKCLEAKENKQDSITVWGTGEVTREFLYVKDAAEAIVRAAEIYNGAEPINIGTGEEIFIKDLVSLIAEKTNFTSEIIWDKTKPDGQPRRCLDITRAKNILGFEAKTSLSDGLDMTIEWYRSNIKGG